MMIQKRPKGEALEASLPANGRPAGGVQGRQRPSAQHFIIIKIFSAGRPWVISFIILKVFFLSFKNILAQATPLRGVLDSKVAKRRSV